MVVGRKKDGASRSSCPAFYTSLASELQFYIRTLFGSIRCLFWTLHFCKVSSGDRERNSKKIQPKANYGQEKSKVRGFANHTSQSLKRQILYRSSGRIGKLT
jgi:hypothetical protein